MDDVEKLIEERGKDYGDPRYFFSQLSGVWTAMLGIPVSPTECVALMIAFKNLRLINNPTHKDTIDDIEGYNHIAKILSELDRESKN